MNKPLSIEHAQNLGIKGSAKVFLGSVASLAFPRQTSLLLKEPKSSPSTLVDKLVMSYLKQRAFQSRDSQFFERLHTDFWQGEGGSVFSANCDHRFNDLFLGKQKVDFLALKDAWNNFEGNQIVEFGCNSGLVLDYLTKNLGNVESAVGIDINQQQIDENVFSKELDSRILFECVDGGDWLIDNGKPNTLFVTNGGVLEYFRRERLNEMMRHISNQLQPSIFFAIEPVAADHDWATTKESIPFGKELSFSHNYTDLFESNGFEVIHQRATVFESWTMMATIAKTTHSKGS